MPEEFTTPPVVVYHKSPFTASLPWLAALIFSTMLMSAYIETTTSWFELCSLIGFITILWVAFLGVLLTNEKLGSKISIDTTQCEISVHSRGLRTEFKQDTLIKYENSDTIINTVRRETVDTKDGQTTSIYYEIQLRRTNRSRELIFDINTPLLSKSKSKAKTLAKKIAKVANLEYLENQHQVRENRAQELHTTPLGIGPLPHEEDEEEPIKFSKILS